MKISGVKGLPATSTISLKALNPTPDSDLLFNKNIKKSTRRKTRTPKFSARKNGVPNGKRSRPETPLLRWKFDDKVKVEEKKDVDVDVDVDGDGDEDGDGDGDGDGDEKSVTECGRRKSDDRKERKGREEVVAVAVSARKLASGLWRLQLPEAVAVGSERRGGVKRREDRLGFQPGVGHLGVPFHCHRNSRPRESESENDLLQSPRSISGPRNGFFSKLEPSFQFSNTVMEGATKWDPICGKTSNDVPPFYSYMKPLEQQVSAVTLVTALEAELGQARARIQDLETERKSSKKKVEHFLRKLSDERTEWRRREHEKVRVIIDDVKADLSRERKNRQRMEVVHSKLVNELAEAKLTAKRFMQDYEKERKARELIEEVCDELAKEIGDDKAEVEAFKRDSMNLRDEVDEERKMLQMAEVWREERVQMKLIDAKVALEEKYSQMNKLVASLETFLRSTTANLGVKEMKEAEMLQQAAASLCIQEIKEFSYEPPNSNDIFSVFEDVNFGELNGQEIDPRVVYSPASHASKMHTVSPEVNLFDKDGFPRHSNVYIDQDGDIEEDGSGWETVSQLEDQDSSYSPDGSAPSVNRIREDSNVSGSETEWEDNAGEEMPITEIGEVCLVPSMQMKKPSSISKLWRPGPNNGENYKIISVDGINGRLSNGRKSNVSIHSSDQGSGKDGRKSTESNHSLDRGSGKDALSPLDFVEQWSSPDSGNPHITRGMKGCIEWPRGVQKNSLKSRLLEARMESQKVQLRQVLKQKI